MFIIFKKMAWFFKYYKKEYSIAFVLMIISYSLFLVPAKIIGEISDGIANSSLTKEELYGKIIFLLASTLICYVSNYIWQYFIFHSNDWMSLILRRDMAKKILSESPRFFELNSTGSLMGKITTDVSNLAEMSGWGVLAFFESFIALAIYLGAMFYINPVLSLVSFLPLPLIAVFTKIISSKLYVYYDRVEKSNDKLNEIVLENVVGTRVVRAYAKEENENRRFQAYTKDLYLKLMDEANLSSFWGPIGRITSGVAFVIALVFGARLIGESKLTIGSLVTFVMYLNNIVGPMFSLGDYISVANQAAASSDRIQSTIKQDPSMTDGSVTLDALEDKSIVFNNLTFKYPSSTDPLLKDISLSINPKETVAVVGKVGSGKTTFLKQVLKFYNLDRNMLSIGGIDINDITFESLRDKIGYVPQNHYLFSKSLKENVEFGLNTLENIDEDKVVEALVLADLYKDTSSLPEGLDTLIGEKGVALSGGQKQRLQIARALIKNPELLILDDSLSAVDAKTEEKILKNLKEKRAGKMTLISAHRLSAVMHADKIIVLKDGSISEFGNHDELMAKKAWYYEQFNAQQKEG